MGCSTRKYAAPLRSGLSFLCKELLLFSLFLLRSNAFLSGKTCENAICHYPSRLEYFKAPVRVPRTNAFSPEMLQCRGYSFQTLFTHKEQCFSYSFQATNKNKNIRPNSGVSLKGGLLPLKKEAKTTFLSMGTLATNGDPGDSRKSMIQRVWSNTIGRLWQAVLFILKVAMVKPLVYLKSIIVGKQKQKTGTDTPVDEETFITTMDNLAVEDDTAAISEADIAQPSSIETEGSSDNGFFAANTKTRVDHTESDVMPAVVVDQHLEDTGSAHGLEPKQDVETVVKEMGTPEQEPESGELLGGKFPYAQSSPIGERWAISSPNVDLTGVWKIKVTDGFKEQYDTYLRNLGQPLLVRSIALSIIGMTKEETKQTNHGRDLWIKGTNTRGVWERTLHASGSCYDVHIEDFEDYEHRTVPLVTADSEKVEAQSWWENEGTVHVSWLRGGKKYGGGDFYSRRYLKDGGNTFICETIFHPRDESREEATVTWTFEREV